MEECSGEMPLNAQYMEGLYAHYILCKMEKIIIEIRISEGELQVRGLLCDSASVQVGIK